jgi:TolB-like protein/cytochrome c-type biogenesis protein CcmH/NrfG
MKAAPWFIIAMIASTLTAWPAIPTTVSNPGTSLAVLVRPADATAKYLASDYARALIHLLGGADHLTVVPRSSVLHAEATDVAPAGTGRGVAANYVLSATVRVDGDALNISAELINSATGTKRWQNTYRSNIGSAAKISARIAHDTLGALDRPASKIASRERDVVTANPVAWSHYLRGRQAMDTLSEPSLVEAIAQLERATTADETFVLAHVALASAHIALGYNFRTPRVHFEKARQSLTRSPRPDAPLVEATVADAVLKYYYEWNWTDAARGAAFTTQHDLSAVETHACFLHGAQTMGRIEEGQQQTETAHRVHPDSPSLRGEVACATYYGGKFADAERESRSAIKLDPENPLLDWSLARALAQQGKFDLAVTALKMAQSKPGGDWTGILAELAYIHGRQNRTAQAREVIGQLIAREKTEYVDHYLHAMAYAGLGETADVFRHLEQAASDRSSWIPSLPVDPKFAALRTDLRYTALMRRLNLAVP